MTRVRRTRGGDFRVQLPSQERLLLASLPSQILPLVQAGDPAAGRLFPAAYVDDPDEETAFRAMVRDELIASHQRSLEVLEETAYSERLDARQAEAWLAALNAIRLVLGEQLAVTEDSEPLPADHPDAAVLAVYYYLGWLQSDVVDALAGAS